MAVVLVRAVAFVVAQADDDARRRCRNRWKFPTRPSCRCSTGDYSFPLHIGLPLTIVIAVVVAVLLSKTVFGLRLRAVGLNPVAANRAGISYARTVVFALAQRRRARRIWPER